MEIERKRKRVEKTTVACPIVFGSFATWLGKKADETATHKWCVLQNRCESNTESKSFSGRCLSEVPTIRICPHSLLLLHLVYIQALLSPSEVSKALNVNPI